MSLWLPAVILSLLQSAAPVQKPTPNETYRSAAIDSNGRLVITTTDRRTIHVLKAGEQSSFGEPTVSPDRTAVGVQALFPNCCTSYDIPLQLVVYADGRQHRFRGNGLPVFQWGFMNGGARVAYGQEPVHFGCAVHYELRDVRTERLIDTVDVPQPCGQDPAPKAVKVPPWVAQLNAARK